MRYLKEYKLFESYDRYGCRRITESEFDKIRKENCKNWTKVETELLRGMPDLGDYVFVDPKKGDFRNSIEDTNIHLDLLSNLPSWKEYPKYDRCVIGGTPGAVGTYGETIYEVVPFDNIKIAVCPYATIWESFGNDDDEFGGDINLVNIFLNSIGLNDTWIQRDGETIEDKLKSIKSFDLKPEDKYWLKTPFGKDIEMIETLCRRKEWNTLVKKCSLVLNKKKEEITGFDFFDYINEFLFNPEERGFQLKTYEPGFKVENRRQIWTEGPVLLVKAKLV
jgi:hypothetical protein